MKTVLFALAAAQAASATVLRAKPPAAIAPALKLRGGLADIDAAQVSKIALYLKAAAGAYLTLSPKAATETSGALAPKTEMNEFMLENAGTAALAAAVICLKLLNGDAATEAVVWGLVPAVFMSVKNLLTGKVESLGIGFGCHAVLRPVHRA